MNNSYAMHLVKTFWSLQDDFYYLAFRDVFVSLSCLEDYIEDGFLCELHQDICLQKSLSFDFKASVIANNIGAVGEFLHHFNLSFIIESIFFALTDYFFHGVVLMDFHIFDQNYISVTTLSDLFDLSEFPPRYTIGFGLFEKIQYTI